MEPSALLVAAVIASPVSIRARLVGAVLGTAILALMNLVRIVSLFYVGIHAPRVFEIIHVKGWQPAFILLALAFWVSWARWARGRETTTADASG
jgi:exosortase/archaeosortase family protein